MDGNSEQNENETATVTKKKLKILSVLKDYTANCTIHGINRVFNTNNSWLKRLIQFFFFSASVIFFVYNVKILFQRFLDRPTTTKTRVVRATDLRFPAVTICNYNAIVLSSVKRFAKENGIESLEEIDNLNMSTEYFLQNNGHSMKKDSGMLVSCSWNGKDCSSNNFTSVINNMGLCHTFNSGKC